MSNQSTMLTPTIPSAPTPSPFSTGPSQLARTASTTSVKDLAQHLASASSSTSSLHFLEGDVEVVREKGLRHAKVKLEARQYKTENFILQLLACLRTLRVPFWSTAEIAPGNVKIHKVSGSLTNAVFFVSHPSSRKPYTILLRIYGLSSGSLISRPRELHILHILSSRYRIGPRVYGTFENGRIEEYFESTTLTPSDIRDPTISRWIGARMAELHSVDIEAVERTSPLTRGEGNGWEIGAKKNVKSWLPPAEEVLSLPSVANTVRSELDLQTFKGEWKKYMDWLSTVEDVHNGSRRVFAHNDAQYGNLLRLQHPKDVVDEHRQLVVVDFEYASPNPAAFDIANHFHEWTANYHSSTPHLLDPSRYPTIEERRNFYTAYLGHTAVEGEYADLEEADRELQLANLDEQVRIWSPASHAMWAIWGIVQAREDVEGNVKEPEFDYISYAICRMIGFRREIRALGI
ncbi:putative choline kinase [Hypsizygus marmoreus]|uniref:Choline kinase n=1 Tax=Hypsizygus marmoreus TaxID=39966 RepID=A0A369K9C5_HYPMA|nr:putative choline kinase [Hypsizygus marmoreus]